MFRSIFVFFACTLLLLAGIYPLAVFIVGKAVPAAAHGFPITYKGKLVGYENIGQLFDSAIYFSSRPSAVSYNAAAAGSSNLGPTNPAHLANVLTRTHRYDSLNHTTTVAADAVTASGSGLDPHISPANAQAQAARVAAARRVPLPKVQKLVSDHTEPPLWGLFGPKKVNVLTLNLALDSLLPMQTQTRSKPSQTTSKTPKYKTNY